MKAKNLNNSSTKTRTLIKKIFAEMLYEKKEVVKISVTELVARANINRGTFYSHYDDIYSVAEDYENELIEEFFDNAKLISSTNIEQFINSIFDYIEKNDENYKLLCTSNDLLLFVKKLSFLIENKLLEICYNEKNMINKQFLDLEINVFVEGILCEYFKYCRGYATITLTQLRQYVEIWCKDFINRHFSNNT